MNQFSKCLISAAMLYGASAMPAVAASSAVTSLSDIVTTAVGSLSGSVKKSSDSSSKDKEVAEGDYKVIDVAALPEQPGTVRMKLQALAAGQGGADAEFYLYLPQKAVDTHHVSEGQVVTATLRPYGYEFALTDTKQAFFLVLQDEWYRELQTNAVTL